MTGQRLNSSGKRAVIAPFRWLIVQGLFFFICAGNVDNKMAWVYFAAAFVISCFTGVLMCKVIPELANQRGEYKKDTKSWDLRSTSSQ